MKTFENRAVINKNLDFLFEYLFNNVINVLEYGELIEKGVWSNNEKKYKGNKVLFKKDKIKVVLDIVPKEILESVLDNNYILIDIKIYVIEKTENSIEVKLKFNVLNIKNNLYKMLNKLHLIKLRSYVSIKKLSEEQSLLSITATIKSFIPFFDNFIEEKSYEFFEYSINKCFENIKKIT